MQLILENSGNFKFTPEIFVNVIVFFVISLAPASVALGITSTEQNFGHLVEALYEAHCVSVQTADSAEVQFSHHAL